MILSHVARYHYFLKTILFFNEYLDTENGSYNTTQLRFLYPIGNKAWNLRFDLPLISANTNSDNKVIKIVTNVPISLATDIIYPKIL